jgi:hypothetical protein
MSVTGLMPTNSPVGSERKPQLFQRLGYLSSGVFSASDDGGTTLLSMIFVRCSIHSRWRDVQQMQGDVGHYLISDHPLTESAHLNSGYFRFHRSNVAGPNIQFIGNFIFDRTEACTRFRNQNIFGTKIGRPKGRKRGVR